MTLDEYGREHLGRAVRAQIIATELSRTMLKVSQLGEYDSLAMARGLSNERLQRYFDKTAENRWAIKPELKANIEFRTLNYIG